MPDLLLTLHVVWTNHGMRLGRTSHDQPIKTCRIHILKNEETTINYTDSPVQVIEQFQAYKY